MVREGEGRAMVREGEGEGNGEGGGGEGNGEGRGGEGNGEGEGGQWGGRRRGWLHTHHFQSLFHSTKFRFQSGVEPNLPVCSPLPRSGSGSDQGDG